jgi:hypothetical protein
MFVCVFVCVCVCVCVCVHAVSCCRTVVVWVDVSVAIQTVPIIESK